MVKSGPPSQLRMEDYDAIQDAVMETERGRWFLREYAQRNRSADTEVLLSAIQKLHNNLVGHSPASETHQIKFDLIDMANAIAETKRQISAMGAEDGDKGKMTMASSELDAIVRSAEKATGDILNSAEQIQEIAWNLREQEVDDKTCDNLDKFATDIYTACSFQDLTGQRTDKVISVLQFVENRVNAMMEIWELDEENFEHKIEQFDGLDSRPDAHLLNGPQLEHDASSQSDIDDMMSEDMFEISVDEIEQFEPEDIDPQSGEFDVSGPEVIECASTESEAPYSTTEDSAQAMPEAEFDSEIGSESVFEAEPEPELASEPVFGKESEPEILAEPDLMPKPEAEPEPDVEPEIMATSDFARESEVETDTNLDDVIQDEFPSDGNTVRISEQELQALTPSDETIEIGTADEFAETPSSIEQMRPPSLDQMAGDDIDSVEPATEFASEFASEFESESEIVSSQEAEDFLSAPLINTADPKQSGFDHSVHQPINMAAPVTDPAAESADPIVAHHETGEEAALDIISSEITPGFVDPVSVDPVSIDTGPHEQTTCLGDLTSEQRQVIFS